MHSDGKMHMTFIILAVTSWTVSSNTDVTTTDGKLRGFKKYVEGNYVVDTFLGVPYARPPLKKLRFKPPLPSIPWKEKRSAKSLPNSCLQVELADNKTPVALLNDDLLSPPTRVSEDCLYLNVWVPRKNSNETLSTLVWFHGGDFAVGSGSSLVTDGAYLAAKFDVVVISVNYRLGVAGFFYTGNQGFDAKGNMGLLDQKVALKWIYNNVGRFRGSRHDITLFGVDSGAASIGFHLLSPQSWPYFTRAILQSGSPLSSWALTSSDVTLRKSLELAALVGCNQSDTEEVMMCMRELSEGALLNAQRQFMELDNRFMPIMDRKFLGDDPEILLKAGKAKPAAVLIGINQNDGVQTLMSRLPRYFPTNTKDIYVSPDVFNNDVIEAFLPVTSNVQSKILEFLYTDLVPPSHKPNSYYRASESLVSDVVYRCDVIKFAKAYCVKSDVYMYSFQHRISTEVLPEWAGVAHYGEIALLFGVPFQKSQEYTQQEKILSNAMMELWTNFAKSGSPNFAPHSTDEIFISAPQPRSNIVWPRYDLDTQRYLVMDTKEWLITQTALRHAQCSFLGDLLPLMIDSEKASTDQCRCTTEKGGDDDNKRKDEGKDRNSSSNAQQQMVPVDFTVTLVTLLVLCLT